MQMTATPTSAPALTTPTVETFFRHSRIRKFGGE
jgi:hypothetical protein